MPKAITRFLSLPKRLSNHIAISFLLVATLAVSIGAAARLKMWRGSFDGNHQNPSAVPSQRRVQVVSFTLYDVGIYPQEARANPGPIRISIEDLTGSNSGLIVERVDETARTHAGVVQKLTNQLRSSGELRLSVGRYELVDATRPDNRALLIVEP